MQMSSPAAEGNYTEMGTGSGEVAKVRSNHAYTAEKGDELSFPANAVIGLISKDDMNWWAFHRPERQIRFGQKEIFG